MRQRERKKERKETLSATHQQFQEFKILMKSLKRNTKVSLCHGQTFQTITFLLKMQKTNSGLFFVFVLKRKKIASLEFFEKKGIKLSEAKKFKQD